MLRREKKSPAARNWFLQSPVCLSAKFKRKQGRSAFFIYLNWFSRNSILKKSRCYGPAFFCPFQKRLERQVMEWEMATSKDTKPTTNCQRPIKQRITWKLCWVGPLAFSCIGTVTFVTEWLLWKLKKWVRIGVSVGAYKKMSQINAFHHIDRMRPHNQCGWSHWYDRCESTAHTWPIINQNSTLPQQQHYLLQ